MGLTKKEGFSKNQNELARFAKALGHPARIAIIQFLALKKECICSTIVDELPLSQATVSQHLKELKNVGLIQGEINGPRVCYCLNEKILRQVQNVLADLLKKASESCC